jgi:hypothetical protein
MSKYFHGYDILDEIADLRRRIAKLEGENGIQTSTIQLVDGTHVPIQDAVQTAQDALNTYETAPDAPTHSPTPNVEGNINTFHLWWDPVLGDAEVVYEIHMMNDANMQATPANIFSFIGETTGSTFTVRRRADGSALVYGDDDGTGTGGQIPRNYYFQIIAKNGAGPANGSDVVTAQLKQINSPDLALNAVSASHLVFDNAVGTALSVVGITANTLLTGKILTAESGARMEADAAGLRIYGPTGDLPRTELATDPAKLDRFTGQVVADQSDIRQLTITGPSRISPGGSLTLGGKYDIPPMNPQVDQDDEYLGYFKKPTTNTSMSVGGIRGIIDDPTSSGDFLALLYGVNAGVAANSLVLYRYVGTTLQSNELLVTINNVTRTGGLTRIGNVVYILYYAGSWKVKAFDVSS